jgi:hypothetical protein
MKKSAHPKRVVIQDVEICVELVLYQLSKPPLQFCGEVTQNIRLQQQQHEPLIKVTMEL